MAYGQTGSGKTYTMLGTPEEPGIAPRAFTRLFQLLDEGRARQEAAVSTYMLELYNDKLIDLLKPAVGADVSFYSFFCFLFVSINRFRMFSIPGVVFFFVIWASHCCTKVIMLVRYIYIHISLFTPQQCLLRAKPTPLTPLPPPQTDRLDIKRDKKGAVHVQGAAVRSVSSASELNRAFNEGLANRHTAATKMNVESSRSHLLIAVCLSITSKQTGSVLRGKVGVGVFRRGKG